MPVSILGSWGILINSKYISSAITQDKEWAATEFASTFVSVISAGESNEERREEERWEDRMWRQNWKRELEQRVRS